MDPGSEEPTGSSRYPRPDAVIAALLVVGRSLDGVRWLSCSHRVTAWLWSWEPAFEWYSMPEWRNPA